MAGAGVNVGIVVDVGVVVVGVDISGRSHAASTNSGVNWRKRPRCFFILVQLPSTSRKNSSFSWMDNLVPILYSESFEPIRGIRVSRDSCQLLRMP